MLRFSVTIGTDLVVLGGAAQSYSDTLKIIGVYVTQKHYFVPGTSQKPDGYFPVEMDYGDDTDGPQTNLQVDEKSSLPEPVQQLIRLIFDVNVMKQTLREFEVTLVPILYNTGPFHIRFVWEVYFIVLKMFKTNFTR